MNLETFHNFSILHILYIKRYYTSRKSDRHCNEIVLNILSSFSSHSRVKYGTDLNYMLNISKNLQNQLNLVPL